MCGLRFLKKGSRVPKLNFYFVVKCVQKINCFHEHSRYCLQFSSGLMSRWFNVFVGVKKRVNKEHF